MGFAGRCALRRYEERDIARLAKIAAPREVSRYMSMAFPYPYRLDDARWWVAKAAAEMPVDNLAIVVDGSLAGGIGIAPQIGERAGVAEFGYWLGIEYWGRGITCDAIALMLPYAFHERGLRRLEATVFAPNAASARVLEKSGFVREAIHREALTDRDGIVVDGLHYALLASDWNRLRSDPDRVQEVVESGDVGFGRQ